jgi:hypothetical protein
VLRDELGDLFSAELFESLYLESPEELFARGSCSHLTIFEGNASSGDKYFINVRVGGGPWNMEHIAALTHNRLGNQLDQKQMGELFMAYQSIGIHRIQTNSTVKFFNSVSYWVRGRAITEQRGEDDRIADDELHSADQFDKELRQVKVTVGDILECVDNSPDGYRGRGFGRTIGIMVHDETVFLVLTWLIPTGRFHSRLKLPEFKETALFDYAAFHPLSIVDHPRFVNSVYFFLLEGSLWLDEWVFRMI